MVLIVSGFPSNVSALQFEHALQHPHTTRHITAKSVPGNRGLDQKIANVKLLLASDYFQHLPLTVTIFDDVGFKAWQTDKYHIGSVGCTRAEYAEFVKQLSTPKDDSGWDTIKLQLMSLQECNYCKGVLDAEQLRLVTKYQNHFYHLTCLSKLQDNLVPFKIGTEYWIDIVRLATRIREYFLGESVQKNA